MISNHSEHSAVCTSSFMLWIDNWLTRVGSGFVNYSGDLYSTTDPRFRNKSICGSPFRQWVADSSVEGASIPSGVFSGATFVPRGTNGLAVDFLRGRVISDAPLENVSCSYALKELNIYYTDVAEEELLFERKFDLVNTTDKTPAALAYNSLPFPCVFVKNVNMENVPHALGGMDDTVMNIRCIVLANSVALLDNSISLLNDSARCYFPLIEDIDLPFNAFGDFKSGSYNYLSLAAANPGRLACITKVRVSKFDERVNKMINDKSAGAFVDFSISYYRYPRVRT